MTQTFLVIGSNSFTGGHFVHHLLEHGHKVIGVSRSEEPHNIFLPYKYLSSKLENFHFERIDLNYDLISLMKIIRRHCPGYIVNFAAQGMVSSSWENPEHWYQTNVLAQVKFHNKLRRLDFIKKYVHVTTPEVYGNTNDWVKENFQFVPSTPYAVSRAACDLHLMSFFKAYGFPVVFTRAANVYGPCQQPYRIIPRAMLYAKINRKLQLHGGGKSVRSFIHIKDVANATLKISLNGIPGTSYHISTRSSLSIRELVERISHLTGSIFCELVEESEELLGKDQKYLLDSSQLREELDWEDSIDLNRGLTETLSWVEKNLSILKKLPLDYKHKP